MNRFYIIFFSLIIFAYALFYLSLWWAIGGLILLLIFVAYTLFASRLKASTNKNEELEKQLEMLHIQLEGATLKEQKTSKEAIHIRQMKEELFTVLSHEIRTPMNGVLGMTMLLSETSLTKEQDDCVNTIRNCGESLLTTVNNLLANDVLNFSKLQCVENKLEFKDFELRDCVEEVFELFAEQAGKAGIDLVYHINENVPAQIIGDHKRLRQVIMNLVENAVKFTNSGEVFLGISVVKQLETGYPPELAFEIRDSGIGITSDELSKLFNGIHGKNIPKISSPDTQGLGLVICRQLVELMGGRIKVESETGNGSTFTFSIPIIPSANPKRKHLQLINLQILEDKQILIVDDNTTNLDSLTNLVKSWKMLPVFIDSAQQCLEILESKNDFDLVLTDLHMPGMGGIQLAKTLRTQLPLMPIIGMNRAGDEEYKQHSGLFSTILNKPTRQNILRDKMIDIFSNPGRVTLENSNQISADFSQKFPLRILVAEDNLINQKIAKKILSKLGYDPQVANNGKEAIEMISHDHYDLILMDVQMPEMDGLEATRMIRTCIDIQPIIIAVTANVMQGDRNDCIQSGMDDYMSKPIDLKELVNQLEKWSLVINEKKKDINSSITYPLQR